MQKWFKNIPEGTKDSLFEECKIKRKVENELKTVFEGMGYNEIITPSIEFLDVFYATDTFKSENMYKLSDAKNRLLVLRPDCTTPIARVVSTRLKDVKRPIKLYYNQNVFRANDNFNGKRDEFTQSGVELIGADGFKADLDIILTAISALKSCFGNDFKVEIGHIGFFKAIAELCQLSNEDYELSRNLIEQKNLASLNALLSKYGQKAEKLKMLPRLFGGNEVFVEAEKLKLNKQANDILNYLKKLYDELCNLGYKDNIIVDLGLVNKINYYTGIVFIGYVDGSGKKVLSGGRYDNLLSKFGTDEDATGFAINVDCVADIILKKK